MKLPRTRQGSDGIWAAALGFLVLLQFWWLPGAPESVGDSYSDSLDGKLGLYRILSQLWPGVRRETRLLVPDDARMILLIDPSRYPNAREQDQLWRFVRRGGAVVFAPNWSESDCEIEDLGIDLTHRTDHSESAATDDEATRRQPTSPIPPKGARAEPGERSQFLRKTYAIDATTPLVAGSFAWRTRARLRLEQNYQVVPLVTSNEGEILAAGWPVGRGFVVVSSSPDIFSNHALLDEPTAELAVRLVEYADQRVDLDNVADRLHVVFDETLNASDAYRYTGILFSPALRSGTLQLMAIAMLWAWFGFHRFGPTQRHQRSDRKSLIASAEAVGNLQYRSPDGGRVVANYMAYIESQLRRAVGYSIRMDDYETIAKRSGLPEDEIRDHLAAANQLVQSSRVSTGQAAGTIRWLATLRQKLFRGD